MSLSDTLRRAIAAHPGLGLDDLMAHAPEAESRDQVAKLLSAMSKRGDVARTGEPGAFTYSITEAGAARANDDADPPAPRPPRTWSHTELLERIPTTQPAGTDGNFLVLRAISHTHGPAGIESIELRINALDAALLRVQVGYQINRGGRTRTSPPLNNIRSMLEDALHDALQVIAEKEAWSDLADVVTGWPLSKRFRNLGVQAWR